MKSSPYVNANLAYGRWLNWLLITAFTEFNEKCDFYFYFGFNYHI